MKKIIKKIYQLVFGKAIDKKRENFRQELRSKLTNKNPTIISNNCLAGVIYSDLGIKFNSPTINLFLKDEEFIEFVNNLEYYTTCDMVEAFQEGANYPIGLLQKGEKSCKLHYLHDTSFEFVRAKWIERCSRIDYDNIFILFEVGPRSSEKTLKAFNEFKYKNKMLICDINPTGQKDIVPLKIYNKNWYGGKILRYANCFATKRRLHDIDFVSFLNG